MGARLDHAVAAGWGFAEATAFFIVPDVWLSKVALRHPRRAMEATLSALGGALVGGVLTYRWGAKVPAEESSAMLQRLPAISETMITNAERDLVAKGDLAVLVGPTKGVPYKIFARTSGLHGRSLPAFLAWSVPARMTRFVLVPGASHLAHVAGKNLFPRQISWLAPTVYWGGWTAFYVWYFRTVGRD